MNIYRVVVNVNVYKWFYLQNFNAHYARFDGQSKVEWNPPSFLAKQERLAADFNAIAPGSFAINLGTKVLIGHFLIKYGELLPITCDEIPYFAFNALKLVDCLDVDRTSKQLIGLHTNYFFNAFKIPMDIGLFKVPQTCRAELFTVEVTKDVNREFKAMVEYYNLTGLTFQKVWSDAR